VTAYGRCATRVLERAGIEDLRDVRYEVVEKALASLGKELEGGWQPNTFNVYVASLRSFWDYIVIKRDLEDLGVKNVGAKLEPMSSDVVDRAKVQHEVLTRDEFLSIVRRGESQGEIEWGLAARFAWTTIARISDVGSLTWNQLDLGLAPRAFYERPSKRGSRVTKLLDVGLARRLKSLQRLRTPSPADRVFGKAGERPKAFRGRFDWRLKELAFEADVGKYVHPHLIRASAATHATVAGCPELFVQRQGGWKPRTALDAYRREDPETWRKWVVELALD